MASRGYEIGNIGEKERARLRVAGWISLAFGVLLAAIATYYPVPWWVRPAVFVSFWSGVSALLQAREQTSIRLAARRVRKIDGKEEPEPYVIEFRGRARMIQRRSLFVAVLLMTLVTILVWPLQHG